MNMGNNQQPNGYNQPPMGYNQPPMGHNPNLGNLLVEGNGKTTKAMWGWVVFYIGMAVFSFVLAFVMGRTTTTVNLGWLGSSSVTTTNAWFPIWIIIGIAELIIGGLTAYSVSQTHIKVFEGGIVGRGISKWFYFGDIRGFNFMLTHDQANVQMNGEQLIVNT